MFPSHDRGVGGGAGGVGPNSIHFQSGTASGGAGLASSITGSSVTRALGGAQGKQGNTGTSGGSNTGTGGRGTGGTTAGAGGSGIVILRYPSKYTITVAGGHTSTTTTVGTDKVTTFTGGTGNVSFA